MAAECTYFPARSVFRNSVHQMSLLAHEWPLVHSLVKKQRDILKATERIENFHKRLGVVHAMREHAVARPSLVQWKRVRVFRKGERHVRHRQRVELNATALNGLLSLLVPVL